MESRNKKVVENYFIGINTGNWGLLSDSLHDNFRNSIKQPIAWKNTSFYEFTRLLDFPEDQISYDFYDYNDKFGYIDSLKWLSKILVQWEIEDMIAEKDKVWLSRIATINDPKQLSLKLNTILIFVFEDNRIIEVHAKGRFLNTLLEYGAIVMKKDDKKQLADYLKSLHHMGLIPSPDL